MDNLKTAQLTPQISVAPMMDWTDRHERYFLRLISPDIQLFTEMITSHALLHGDAKKLLAYHPAEKNIVLQLGGSDPQQLGICAQMGEQYGYDEINLNVGCPSARVSAGRFGACLMLEPQLVADCIEEMQRRVKIPVTVKCRIGVDQQDSEEALHAFIAQIAAKGCQTFIIHARKALLSGLSPKQNRQIPPLRYEVVYRLKKSFPHLQIILNGGLKNINDIQTAINLVDGAMIGRTAYSDPYFLADIQTEFFASKQIKSRREVIEAYIPYMEEQLSCGVRLTSMTRHIMGLFQGQRGASCWRRYLSEHAHAGRGVEVISSALATMDSQSAN